MVLRTDVTAYGRSYEIISQMIQTLRVAFGDFSVIDPMMTFDYYDEDNNYK